MTKSNPLLMPKLGLTMTEGVLASWAVKVGAKVQAGDVLFVVETDKIATEVEARGDGEILSIDVAEGETVPVGALVGRWTGYAFGGERDAIEAVANPEEAAPHSPVSSSATVTPPSTGRILATPLARRLAQRDGIDLNGITGSGPNGRIKAADVVRTQGIPLPPPPLSRVAPNSAISPVNVQQRRPATRMEQIVAKRLTESKQTIPHFYAFAETDVTELLSLRSALNADDSSGSKLSLTHWLASGLAKAIATMPELNARWDNGEIVSFQDVDIGIAVDSPRGLMVPVLRRADQSSLDGLAKAMNALVEKARNGTLEASDMQGGAISISNVGMFGASALVPIIDPDQSAILGVGKPRPVFRPDANGQPALRQELTLILSCDHRIYDGVLAAKLLDQLTRYLENPLRLMRG